MSDKNEHSVDYELLARFFSGETAPDEQARIKEWIRESPENEHEFHQLRTVWLDTGNIRSTSTKLTIDIDAAWKSLDQKSQFTRPKKASSYKWLRIAAIGLVLIGSVWLVNNLMQNDPQEKAKSDQTEVKAEMLAETGPSSVSLSDGSQVDLNEGSTLSFPKSFSGDERLVELEGQAFFDIARDTTKPFIITTEGGNVQVLGTSFMVSAWPNEDEVVVTVRTGKVKLYKEKAEVFLTKGMTGVISKSEGTVSIGHAAPDESYWQNRTLRFESTQIKDVVATLNKVFKANISVENEALNACTLTAEFKDETLENILLIIESTFDFKVKRRKHNIIINGKGC